MNGEPRGTSGACGTGANGDGAVGAPAVGVSGGTGSGAGVSGGTGSGAPSLSSQLSRVRLGVREDLDVTRQLFRGEPSYIVRDPITFQSQRFSPADYDVFVRINPSKSLGEIFRELVAEGQADADAEERFFQFVMSLHRVGFLHLPVSDDKALYRRHRFKMQARAKEKTLGLLFLRIPLVNPNAFLDRTVKYVRWVFTVKFFLAWLLTVAAAGVVLAMRWSDVTEPLQGILATRNLPLMWLTLIGLKLFHELGHAYCCKHYGGHVPEMGAYLIFFTPCAYVDATSSWGFRYKRHRLYVCLAGMYFESMLAALAVFVWAFTGPGLIHSVAHNAIFLATVVTVIFNINPLMRYDGYYVLSDVVEIPNLRAKSGAYLTAWLKRLVFGIRNAQPPKTRREALTLFGYGVAAAIYRIALVLAISAMIATKVFVVGVMLAGLYAGSTIFRLMTRMIDYLWHAEETRHARWRATALSALALIALPIAAFVVPVPRSVQAGAVVLAERETTVFAREDGFVRAVDVERGDEVSDGAAIALLSNDHLDEAYAMATSNLRASEILVDAYRVHKPAFVEQELAKARVDRRGVALAASRRGDLIVRAPSSGRIVFCLDERDRGRFLHKGDKVATLVAGAWQARVILSESQLTAADPREGDRLAFRCAALPGSSFRGTVRSVARAGSRAVELIGLTHLAGGSIAVNPSTGLAQEPYFELVVDLDEGDSRLLRHGMTGQLRLPAPAEPIGVSLSRRVGRFINKLTAGS